MPERPGPDALSITEFYSRVDRALRSAFPEELWITGEIRTIKVLPKGHCFIDLVDPTNARDSGAPTLNVKCWSTQWRIVRSTLDRLGITLDAGMVVRARGRSSSTRPGAPSTSSSPSSTPTRCSARSPPSGPG